MNLDRKELEPGIGGGASEKNHPTGGWFKLMSLGLVLLVVTVAAGFLIWYANRKIDPTTVNPNIEPPKIRSALNTPTVGFTDITSKAGIGFIHVNGAFGKKLLPETMGSGVAFLDYDNDGHQDILLINSCYWPGYEDKTKTAPTQALYRNKGDGTFADVTAETGLNVTFYGMGVTAGDFDNDGWTDLFMSGVGGNHLFHNESDGKKGRRFVDVTPLAGVEGPGKWPGRGDVLQHKSPVFFPSSATFVDYDGDGWLDLFVCQYLNWSPAEDFGLKFSLTGAERAYGRPSSFDGVQCFLYQNQRNGRFKDVSTEAGVHVSGIPLGGGIVRPIGKSLGVIACDVDEDGWPDLIVANDTVRNFFFHNKGNNTFEEKGELAGVAYAQGNARGAMGIDWGEYYPGRFAVIIGNFSKEPNTFLCLVNPKELIFRDEATVQGLSGPSMPLLKFGAFFFDYDLDGRQDILTCNGHLEPDIKLVEAGQTYPQPAQLFWNTGKIPAYEVVPEKQTGPDLFKPLVGRGSAFADIDGDGDLDVILTANGGSARLLRNDGGTGNHWVRIALQGDGKRSNRSAIGARVILEAGGVIQRQQVTAGRGYLSQSELPLTFGLGKATKIDKLTIYWPGKDAGAPDVFTDLPVDRLHGFKQK